jgi:hypothetical protein
MSLTRRDFLWTAPVAGTAFAMWPAVTFRNPAVVSFHMDQPYVDLTGLEKPYIPPAGMRAAAPLANLSDEALTRYYGFI